MDVWISRQVSLCFYMCAKEELYNTKQTNILCIYVWTFAEVAFNKEDNCGEFLQVTSIHGYSQSLAWRTFFVPHCLHVIINLKLCVVILSELEQKKRVYHKVGVTWELTDAFFDAKNFIFKKRLGHLLLFVS